MYKYIMLPSSKATIHLGEVTITEIGISKKEILCHGDSINTASRICATVHSLAKKFLISKPLYDKLNKDSYIQFEDLGEHSRRDKNEKIHLFGI